MTDYKLTYFNARGIAEPIRYIFAVAEVPYEDNRFEKEQWPELKANTPWGQVPILETEGKTLAQSTTIARYLARKFNLVGKDDFESAQCDEIVDAIGDLKAQWMKYFHEQDELKRAELKKVLVEAHISKYFAKFNKIVEENTEGTFLVGNSVTWADLYVAYYLEAVQKTVDESILNDYASLKALKGHVEGLPQIKAWVEKRPPTTN